MTPRRHPRSSVPDRAEPTTGLHIVRPAVNYQTHYVREATLRALCVCCLQPGRVYPKTGEKMKPESKKYSATVGNHTATFETGKLAHLAGGAVTFGIDEAIVFAAAT